MRHGLRGTCNLLSSTRASSAEGNDKLAKFLKSRGISMRTAAAFGVTAVEIGGQFYARFPYYKFHAAYRCGRISTPTVVEIGAKLRSLQDKRYKWDTELPTRGRGFFGLVTTEHCNKDTLETGVDAIPGARLFPKSQRPNFHQQSLTGQATPSLSSVVVTEGELDAMSVYEAVQMPVVSVASGAGSNLQPADVVELDPFREVILWFDSDPAGISGRSHMSRALGSHRVRTVALESSKDLTMAGCKDANDVLQLGPEKVVAALVAPPASCAAGSSIVGIGTITDDIAFRFLNPTATRGFQIAQSEDPVVYRLLSLLGGIRVGEVTVLSGETGVGKTTFLAQLSIALTASRETDRPPRVLWGSFEVPVPALAEKLFRQAIGTPSLGFAEALTMPPIDATDARRELFNQATSAVAEDATKRNPFALPISFLRFHGAVDVQRVVEQLECLLRGHERPDVIIIDNLNFMLSASHTTLFVELEYAFRLFRSLATLYRCHVILVMHPRKTGEASKEMTLHDVAGPARATQEADNVIILSRHRERFRPGRPPSAVPAASGPVPDAPELSVGGDPVDDGAAVDAPGPKRITLSKNRYSGRLGTIYVQDALSTCAGSDVTHTHATTGRFVLAPKPTAPPKASVIRSRITAPAV